MKILAMTVKNIKSIIRNCGFHHCYDHFIHNINKDWIIEMKVWRRKISLFPTKNNNKVFRLDDEIIITSKINNQIVCFFNEDELLTTLQKYFQ